jgi:hypothetical protein
LRRDTVASITNDKVSAVHDTMSKRARVRCVRWCVRMKEECVQRAGDEGAKAKDEALYRFVGGVVPLQHEVAFALHLLPPRPLPS